MKRVCLAFAAPCLLFAAIPLIFYGVFNTGVITLAAVGSVLMLLYAKWDKMKKLRRFLLPILSVCLILAIFLSMLMGEQGWRNRAGKYPVSAVVVLGGKVNGDQPSLMLQRRLDAAADYLRQYPKVLCVVSGGQGSDEQHTEASVMAAYLSGQGIEPQRILQEDASTNTKENLEYSARMLPQSNLPIAIATDGFHQLRASMYADTVGLESYSLSASTPWGLLPCYWVREWVAISRAYVLINFGI